MKVLVLFLIVCTSYASLPSVESLFRHGANADIATNTVKVGFTIEEMDLSSGVPTVKEGSKPSFTNFPD